MNATENTSSFWDETPGFNNEQQKQKPYEPKGGSPLDYLQRGICDEDILLGNGFLERGSAALLAGPSGIGKSSVGMQMGCCWSAHQAAFELRPPKALRIVLMQNEDSANDLVRQSEVVRSLNLDPELVKQNFWIETVRGKIGKNAVKIMHDLVRWHRADVLILNPLTAYHDGDISRNEDNQHFLYGDIGALLDELRIGFFALHHKGKPAKKGQVQQNNGQQDVYFEVMYDILGGSVLTNFFRGIITVSPIGNSGVFKFTAAKRFEESEWTLKSPMWKWHPDRSKRLWVPASVAEGTDAQKKSSKSLEELRKLVPTTGSIPKPTLEFEAMKSGFSRREYEGLLEQALSEDTPEQARLYQWALYNPHGLAKAAISLFPQPKGESHREVRERLQQEKAAHKTGQDRNKKAA